MPKDTRGVRLVQIASIYMVAGLGMGMFMGISQDFRLSSAHAHLALLGWVTLALTGLVYIARPAWSRGGLARAHFWLHNAGLPIMIVSLALFAYGYEGADAFIALGSTVVSAALLLFTIHVLRAPVAD